MPGAAGQGKAGTESKGLEVLLASQLNLAGCREQEAEVGVADRITTILAEHRQRLIGSAGSGQRQSQVGLELDVLRREPRAGFEGSFSIGPPPLKIVAVAGVIPDLGIPRAEPKRLVVVHLRLGETAQPVKCVADPTMRQRLIG